MATRSYDSVIPESFVGQCSLHLVERFRKRFLQLEGFLDLISRDIRILPVFKEARAVMFANKFDECRHVRLPVLRKSFEVLENRVYAKCGEQRYRVIDIFIEINVEDALVHEVLVLAYIEQDPAQVVELQRGQYVGAILGPFSIVFPYPRITCSLSGLTFAMIVKP